MPTLDEQLRNSGQEFDQFEPWARTLTAEYIAKLIYPSRPPTGIAPDSTMQAATKAWETLGTALYHFADELAQTFPAKLEIWQGAAASQLLNIFEQQLLWIQQNASKAFEMNTAARAWGTAWGAVRFRIVTPEQIQANRFKRRELEKDLMQNFALIEQLDQEHRTMGEKNRNALIQYYRESSAAIETMTEPFPPPPKFTLTFRTPPRTPPLAGENPSSPFLKRIESFFQRREAEKARVEAERARVEAERAERLATTAKMKAAEKLYQANKATAAAAQAANTPPDKNGCVIS